MLFLRGIYGFHRGLLPKLSIHKYRINSVLIDIRHKNGCVFSFYGDYIHRKFDIHRFSTKIENYDDVDLNPVTTKNNNGSSAILSQKPIPTTSEHLQMLSFYHFEYIDDPISIRNQLYKAIQKIPGLRGTIYIATEGINVQMAIPPGSSLESFLNMFSSNTILPFDPFKDNNSPNFGDIVTIDTPTFNKLIVRTRDYILRDGMDDDLDLNFSSSNVGIEISPCDWHQQISNNTGVTILDCRNIYETETGTFHNAVPLHTQTFQDTWKQLDILANDIPRDEPICLFCTGGIRCKIFSLFEFVFSV